MKGGKDEEKVMSPLFPRLHINDAEKGGPKAPPRNKMALYEQLSVPTQRFTSSSSSMLPLPHKNTGNLVPSPSSSHHNKIPYPLLGNAPAPHLAERLHSHTSVGAILNTSSKNPVSQLKVTSERDSSNLSLAAPSSNLQPHNFSNFKSTSFKRLREDDNCKVPGFLQLENTLSSIDDPRKKDDLGIRKSRHLKNTSSLFSKHHTSTEANKRMPSSSANKDEILEKRNNLHQKHQLFQKTEVPGKSLRGDPENNVEKTNSFTLQGFKPLLRSVNRTQSNDSDDLQLVEAEKDAENTETCNMDSVPGATISSDAVMEALGYNQFWRARNDLMNQEKAFAVQVFELHKLIKVQKFFAKNPDILMEDKFFTGKTSNEGSDKKLYLENVPEPPPIIPPPKPDPQIPDFLIDNNKGLNNLFSSYKPFTATDPIPSPWSFQPPQPGNQWLVPVMSPSEGLIYKPYTGPCPPTTAVPGPVHSGPMGLGEDYLRFGFFPPYCMPSLNASVSSSVVGPMGPLSRARPKWGDPITYPSSFSSYYRNLVESKESEVHGSTASSPDIKLHENALPLFPTAPTPQTFENKSEKIQTSMNHTRVIKVVPHNARSASESAARIFQSIQEERKQLE